MPADVDRWDIHGRQPRPRLASRRDPVEADHGQVVGHAQARRAQRVEQAEGQLVVVAEHGVGWVGGEGPGQLRRVPPRVDARRR